MQQVAEMKRKLFAKMQQNAIMLSDPDFYKMEDKNHGLA